ncbi:alpha/beta hydrolase [Mariniplasma anaerobium]|uniref:Thioesterase n=1 Tax=Mariniplasma anaerobium TaxID=2735436 RepID=A0A7U9TH61_9MOLU|nr:alpha/beta hydrolase [Mariniplasma anaerobium]BCR35145.1 thioesterase [Mariniplasma anaerobium]
MKKTKKIFKITLITILSLVIGLTLALFIYTRNSYKPLDEMYQEISLLNTDDIMVVDDFDQISYFVDQPIKNIVIIPGGKVKPESYQYLAINLALEGYDVTIVKTVFNLAILTPNYGARFLKDDIDNVVIGHSLGGTVASLFSSKADVVSDIIFLASYPISDVKNKNVLIITGQFDEVLDQESLDSSQDLLPDNSTTYEIIGGNHGQFGWYGIQKGDGIATITTKEQQDTIVNQIIDFIE